MTFLANYIGLKKALLENVLHCTDLYCVDKKSIDMVLALYNPLKGLKRMIVQL